MLTDAEAAQKAQEPEPLTYDADALKGFVKEVKACISTLPKRMVKRARARSGAPVHWVDREAQFLSWLSHAGVGGGKGF